jgi:hypothetical protein
MASDSFASEIVYIHVLRMVALAVDKDFQRLVQSVAKVLSYSYIEMFIFIDMHLRRKEGGISRREGIKKEGRKIWEGRLMKEGR